MIGVEAIVVGSDDHHRGCAEGDDVGTEIWSHANAADELAANLRIEAVAIAPSGCIAVARSEVVVTNESYRAWTRVHAP